MNLVTSGHEILGSNCDMGEGRGATLAGWDNSRVKGARSLLDQRKYFIARVVSPDAWIDGLFAARWRKT